MSVILGTQEVEVGGSWFKTSQDKISIESYLINKTKGKRTGGMAQVVEGLSHKSLSSIPSTAKKSKRKRKIVVTQILFSLGFLSFLHLFAWTCSDYWPEFILFSLILTNTTPSQFLLGFISAHAPPVYQKEKEFTCEFLFSDYNPGSSHCCHQLPPSSLLQPIT
jgi:hypothetical protein